VNFLSQFRKTSKWIDLSLGALVAFLVLVTGPFSGLHMLAGLAYGALWLLIGWRAKLPLLLVAVMLGVASRVGISRGILPGDVWLLVYGTAIWAVSVWIPARLRWTGWGIGALWGALLWWEPGLWLLVLCALPRLAVLNPDRERAVAWSASLVGAGCVVWAMVSGETTGLFERPGDADTYIAIAEGITSLFSTESLLVVIGLVGLFELAQPMEETHKWSWRNLALLGGPLTLLFLHPDRVLPAALWIGFPAAAFLLTRWTLALPNAVTRVLMWIGLVLWTGVLA
jgi:hypothetical protein